VVRKLSDEAAGTDLAPFFSVVPFPHSVVPRHLNDEAGQPTKAGRDKILAYFASWLAS